MATSPAVRPARALIAVLASLLPSQAAQAHDLGYEVSWQAGFLHPFTGPDHLVAMVAVGMVSVVLGGRAVWAVPTTFVLALPVGAEFGYEGWRLAHVEVGVALSVLLLGAALFVPHLARWRPAVFVAVVLFGLCHGYAHGVEMPKTVSPVAFSVGFMSASVILHVSGLFAGEMLSERPQFVAARRAIGAAMAAAGGYFLAVAIG